MLENDEAVRKLKDYLKKKHPKLLEGESEKIAQNLLDLGFFLVRLMVKEHSKAKKPPNTEGFEDITREPP